MMTSPTIPQWLNPTKSMTLNLLWLRNKYRRSDVFETLKCWGNIWLIVKCKDKKVNLFNHHWTVLIEQSISVISRAFAVTLDFNNYEPVTTVMTLTVHWKRKEEPVPPQMLFNLCSLSILRDKDISLIGTSTIFYTTLFWPPTMLSQ